MNDPLVAEIVRIAGSAAPQGVAMGAIVDQLAESGYKPEAIEQAVWELMALRQLTPSGFICRIVRRRSDNGHTVRARAYEFLLIPWSSDMDRQLDLPTGEGEA